MLPQGYCGYPDTDCLSGLRFEGRAPGGLGGTCVDREPSEGTSSESGTETGESAESGDTNDPTGSTGNAACGGPNEECCDAFECNDASLLCFGGACGCMIDLIAGDTHTCVTSLDNHLECWGGNVNQELGRDERGQLSTELAPVLDLPQPLVIVSASARTHTCVVALGGDVYCWGDNTYGQSSPDVDDVVVSRAQRLDAADLGWTPEAVGVGPGHTCIAEGTRVFCWGDNDLGQLGWESPEPQEVDTTEVAGAVVELAAGIGHTCARTIGEDPDATEDQHVYCWGYDGFGQLGAGPGDDSDTLPREVVLPPELGIAAIAASDWSTCVLAYEAADPSVRSVLCWGYDEDGVVTGVGGPPVEQPQPVEELPTGPWEQLSLGAHHACASSEDTGTWCWGNNETGAANPTAGPTIIGPTEVPVLRERDVLLYTSAAGGFHSCGIASDASVTCWGCGALGQLGDEWLFCDDNEGGWGSVRSTCG